jgi:ribosomal protein S12 methylthiotransferase accessory factor
MSNPGPHLLQSLDFLSKLRLFEKPVIDISQALTSCVLQIARIPHKYAFLYRASGARPHLDFFRGHPELGPIAWADGTDLSSTTLALTRCLFELVERVWSPHVNIAELPYKSRKELAGRGLDPLRLTLLSDEEYRRKSVFMPFHEDLRLHWARCFRLEESGALDEWLIPAIFIYPGFGIRCPHERLVPMISTGIAAGARYEDAIFRGLCEVIERDAFAINWIRSAAPPQIPVASATLNDPVRRAIDDLDSDRFRVRLYDLTLDVGIPVAMAAIDRFDGKVVPILGFGSSPLASLAVEKAMCEALQLMANHFKFPGGVDIIRSDKTKASTEAQISALTRFLGSDERSTRFRDEAPDPTGAPIGDLLLQCLRALTMLGLEAYFCDLTPTEFEDLQFALVRVVVPGLQPLTFEPDLFRSRSERLYAPSGALGLNGPAATRIETIPNPRAWDLS